MTLLEIFRFGRYEHEQTHPFPAPKFILDQLEILMSLLEDLTALHTTLSTDAQTLASGIADIKAQVEALTAALAADPTDPAVTAAIAQLQSDVASVDTLAQGFTAATSTAADTAASAAADAAPADPAPADTTATEPAADPQAASSGTYAVDVQTGDAPQ